MQRSDVLNFFPHHHEMVGRWWTAHKWPVIPIKSLPSIGRIAYVDAMPVAAGFLYLTNSDLAWLEFVVTNPDAPLKARHEGVKLIVENLVVQAKRCGARLVFTSAKSSGLISLMQKCGFQKSDEGMTNLIWGA